MTSSLHLFLNRAMDVLIHLLSVEPVRLLGTFLSLALCMTMLMLCAWLFLFLPLMARHGPLCQLTLWLHSLLSVFSALGLLPLTVLLCYGVMCKGSNACCCRLSMPNCSVSLGARSL